MGRLYDIYFLNYNNYFNKTIKRHDTLQEYLNETGYIGGVQGRNFDFADGVNTTHIENWEYGNPNYAVVVDMDGVLSRWFVIEQDKTRGGQFKFTLKRDVVADNIDVVLNSPAFIEKATIQQSDPFIFNDEGMKVNQILRSQTKLKDETNLAWICAYIPHHKTIANDPWYDRPVNASVSNPQANLEYESMQDFEADFESGKLYLNNFTISYQAPGDTKRIFYSRENRTQNSYGIAPNTSNNYWYTLNSAEASSTTYNEAYLGILGDNPTYYSANGIWDKISKFRNKRVKISDTIYMLTIEEHRINNTTAYFTPSTSNLYIRLKATQGQLTENGNKEQIVKVESLQLIELIPTLTPIIDQSAHFTLSTSRRSCIDQAFDMLAFPYNPDNDADAIPIKIGGTTINLDSQAMLNIATRLSETWGNEVVYDVQILPYCPCRDLINVDAIELSNGDAGSKYTAIKDNQNQTIGVCLYARQTSDTFNIEYEIPFEDGKVQIMSEMYRLCSPNYASAYELRPFENYGINYFNVDFTYLPYQPYIKLNPNFKGLNGVETNDSRGLILGGNYSITTLNSAWANYQLNNSNYQAIFDRQIQNAKTNYKYNRVESITSGLLGGLGTSVASGIATGNAGVGVAMGVANAGGLVADQVLNNLKYKESQSYAKDMFNYNLQNVQAQPETISKLTSFNYNSMYFPFVEFYSCSEEEKEAIENKLRYNGMTIMRIGKINDYVLDQESYIQAQMIRLEGLEDDYHMSVEIADAIKRGIYIKRSDI